MTKIRCPNCGNSLEELASTCPCGFSFVGEALAIPAPSIVRTTTPSSNDRLTPDTRETVKADVPGKARPMAKPRAKAPAGSPARPNEAMIMDCPGCDARISKRADECPKCGASPYDICQICASRILTDAVPCSECGDPEPFAIQIA